MVSYSELGSDPPFGSDRDSGRDIFTTFLDSVNAFRSKLVVLTEATGGKGSSLISIAFFCQGT